MGVERVRWTSVAEEGYLGRLGASLLLVGCCTYT